MADAPSHPAEPQWQTFKDWTTMKQPKKHVLQREKETTEDLLKRFGMTEGDGSEWGDASNAQDAGWGLPNQTSNGW